MRTVLYARVSTLDKGQNPETQLRELREYCQRRGWTVEKEFVDVGVSGAKESRPQLDLLMKDAAKRRFDAVIVWRFDRFARSVSHLLRALETFRALGIEFVSYGEAIDTSSAVGKMTFTVLGAVAELERSILMERVNAGIRRAQAAGTHCGRPKGSGAAVIDLSAARVQMAAGASLRAVARSFAVSPSLLCKRLKEVAV